MKMSIESPIRVDLSLVDISGNFQRDSDGSQLKENLCSSQSWRTGFFAKKDANADSHELQKQVTRFLKPKDQYMAYVSVLFKSRAFHRIHDDPEHCSCTPRKRPLPIVALPRTPHRKPYIPVLSKHLPCSDYREEDVFSFSISHQFPFVGIVESKAITTVEDAQGRLPVVGLDIVVFDPIDPRLYSSEDDFLHVFRDQFTHDEWKQGILGSMKEFYIRWAMKEAYTKALGVGMGLAFGSFEIHLFPEDADSHRETTLYASVWERISLSNDGWFRAKVWFPQRTTKEGDDLWIYFVPLNGSIEGCACVCVCGGGVNEKQTNKENPHDISVSWTTAESLAAFHETGESNNPLE